MEDDFDLVLEDAVKDYSKIEPSPDLAARILMQAQRGPAPRRRNWAWALGFALPLAAVALAFMVLRPQKLPAPPVVAAVLAPPVFVPDASPPKWHEAAAVRRTKPRGAAGVWRPAPYSMEELALLAFVEQHPKEALEIAKAQKQDAAPLKVEPITVAPLEIKPISIATLN